jgi:NAD(P)-dependent dehydrogenase (short-subunit alcohol dehydrogenase family)
MRRTFDVNVFGIVAVTQAMLPLLRQSASPRIVNISSPLGSLSLRSDPEHPIAKVGLLAYDSSKTALNSITLHYANALRKEGILVNAANPGHVSTDLNNRMGIRSPQKGARIAVRLATLADGEETTGVFMGDDGVVPW